MTRTVKLGNRTYNLKISFSETANEEIASKMMRIIKNSFSSDFSDNHDNQEEDKHDNT